MILLLKCPKCKHDMKYSPVNGMISGKKKACVYCGHSYKVSESIVKKII